jgi:hypothetical protein
MLVNDMVASADRVRAGAPILVSPIRVVSRTFVSK